MKNLYLALKKYSRLISSLNLVWTREVVVVDSIINNRSIINHIKTIIFYNENYSRIIENLNIQIHLILGVDVKLRRLASYRVL